MPLFKKFAAIAAFACASFGGAGSVLATQPREWGIGMQPSASPFMDQVADFHTLLMVIITLITVFVLGLLVWVMIRYNEKANPNPSKTTHNTLIEIIWTVVPVAILVVIAVPSFRLLYAADNAGHNLPITIKARGHQWFWTYVYQQSLKLNDKGQVVDAGGKVLKWNGDNGKYSGLPVETLKTPFLYKSELLCETAAQCKKASVKLGRKAIRLLDVDRQLVIPTGVKIRLVLVSADVIHAFAMPSMGVKLDAVPGRNNETWLYARKPGIYYGQCSEICGRRHAYMPIAIRAVSPADYAKWLVAAQAKAIAGQDGYEKDDSIAPKKPTKTSSLPAGGRSVAARSAK
jgi:cytochrome c oxidase subunit 2